MASINTITPLISHIVLSIGKTFVFTTDNHKADISLDNGQTLGVYAWRKDQELEISGIIDYGSGLEVQFIPSMDDGWGDFETLPVDDFWRHVKKKNDISSSNLNRGAPREFLSVLH